MAKKKPNFLKRSLQLIRRHKAATILCMVSCLILVLSLGSFVMTRYRDYQNKKIVFQLIDNMKALHTEMEQDLGVTLDKSHGCTQPSGKSTLETDPLQCTIDFRGNTGEETASFFNTIRNKEYMKDEETTSYGYRYSYRGWSVCSMTEISGVRVVLECYFSARHPNKQAILDKLEAY